jgi:hypothetical protein
MAKSQKRGNREARKPKSKKAPSAAVAATVLNKLIPPAAPGQKKKS